MKRKKVPEKIVFVPETDSVYTGTYVVSDNGHLAGRTFVILGGSGEGYVLIADGKKKRIAFPKRKKLSHLSLLSFDPEVAAMIKSGDLKDGILRKKISETKLNFVKECNIQKL